MKPFRSDAILLVVSNPVDVLTSLAQELSGLPKSQVIGSGTFLDTVRLQRLLANKIGVCLNLFQHAVSLLRRPAVVKLSKTDNHQPFQIATTPINLYVLGEHGDSQLVAWSTASISGVPLDDAVPPDTFNKLELANECKHEGQRIIDAKGAIAFGIGSVVARICSSILFDEREVHPISHFQPEFGCCLSLPAVLGRKGITKTIALPLSEEEKRELIESGKVVKEMVQGLMDEY